MRFDLNALKSFHNNLYHFAAVIIRELVDILDDIVQEGRLPKITFKYKIPGEPEKVPTFENS